MSNEVRSEAFGSLRFIPLFVEIGQGFLISLLPKTEVDRLVYIKLTMTADKTPPLNFESGKLADRKMYDAAAYIHAVLGNRDVDLALNQGR